MLDILQFVFSSFWHWLGTVILLAILWNGSIAVITVVAALIAGRYRKP